MEWVKRVKHVGNEGKTSEGASHDAVVTSLRRSIGGHVTVGTRTGATASPARRGNDGGVGEASKARRERGGKPLRARVTTPSLRR